MHAENCAESATTLAPHSAATALRLAHPDHLLWTTNEEIKFHEWRRRPWRHRLIDGTAYLARRELIRVTGR